MQIKPHYEHDCSICIFLGWFQEEYKGKVFVYDLYHCGQIEDRYPTIIARWSSEGSHYSSGMPFGKHGNVPSLVEAYKRAVERKLNVRCGCALCFKGE